MSEADNIALVAEMSRLSGEIAEVKKETAKHDSEMEELKKKEAKSRNSMLIKLAATMTPEQRSAMAKDEEVKKAMEEDEEVKKAMTDTKKNDSEKAKVDEDKEGLKQIARESTVKEMIGNYEVMPAEAVTAIQNQMADVEIPNLVKFASVATILSKYSSKNAAKQRSTSYPQLGFNAGAELPAWVRSDE
ncbi:MAG: hypothetical protein K8823_1561 [Cenarchaeum symbiont of Oopsacas minuta]|nr:hypothetical protein [Cenarchaeum symbiont of Oopsacas minuta]